MRPQSRSEEHVGEWKVTLWADTPEGLFVEAARVLARQCGPLPGGEAPDEWERIEVAAADFPSLLADWLNELLGRSEIGARAYGEVRNLRLDDGARLQAEVRGRPVREWRSSLKAATYHGLELGRSGPRWKAVVLFDV